MIQQFFGRSLNWQHKQCKDPRPNPVIKTLFVDHVCEPQENVPLPLPFENNLENCLSLSLSTGNILQPSQATSNPLPTSSAELSQKFICNTRCALFGSSISQCCKEPR
ncbi:unnamed protein product [Prunus armeniaca]